MGLTIKCNEQALTGILDEIWWYLKRKTFAEFSLALNPKLVDNVEQSRGPGRRFLLPTILVCLFLWPILDERSSMGRFRSQPSSAANRKRTPGERLRAARLVRGMSLRDVHQASVTLAKRLRNDEFSLPPSRLHEIEARNVVPSIHRLYTLSAIYGYDVVEFLDWYGIPQQTTSAGA